jgi:hypothetical protein
MAEHVLDVMHRPTGFQQTRAAFVPQIMEVQIDGSIGSLRLCTQFRAAFVRGRLLFPNPDGLVAVCPKDGGLPGSLDASGAATDVVAEHAGAWRVRPAIRPAPPPLHNLTQPSGDRNDPFLSVCLPETHPRRDEPPIACCRGR